MKRGKEGKKTKKRRKKAKEGRKEAKEGRKEGSQGRKEGWKKATLTFSALLIQDFLHVTVNSINRRN